MLKKLEVAGDTANYNLLLDQYQYDGMDTCAVDGLCATACPVDINTGDLIKRLRRENHSAYANKIALLAAKNFKTVEWAARAALKMGFAINKIFGKNAMIKMTGGIKKVIPAMPLWSNHIDPPPDLSIIKAKRSTSFQVVESKVVYFPACISRMMGTYKGKKKNLMETFMSICNKSGIQVIVLDNIKGSCCSQIFSSKGFSDAYSFTANKIIEQLWKTSLKGSLPIVIDVSSCAYTLQRIRPVLTNENKTRFDKLTILDSVEFLHDMVMPVADVKQKKNNIVLHPVCSLEKMKIENKFIRLANHFANDVTVPKYAGCCGMAGDCGFLFPELTASATLPEALEVSQKKYKAYYSSTKTCEIAMSDAVKENYESILYLVNEVL